MRNSRFLAFPAIPALLALAIPAGAESLSVDPVHSTAIFKIAHMGVSNFIGRFDALSGTVEWDGADPSKVAITYDIKTDSVDTNFEKRNQHVKSADFLDAKQFPDITFVSTAVKKSGDDFAVDGNLTLHGVTKPISITVKKTGEAGGRLGFWTVFTVKRSDYGVTFMPDKLGDEVEVTLSTEVAAATK